MKSPSPYPYPCWPILERFLSLHSYNAERFLIPFLILMPKFPFLLFAILKKSMVANAMFVAECVTRSAPYGHLDEQARRTVPWTTCLVSCFCGHFSNTESLSDSLKRFVGEAFAVCDWVG